MCVYSIFTHGLKQKEEKMWVAKAFAVGAGISQIPIIGPVYIFICHSITIIITVFILLAIIAPASCGYIARSVGIASEEEIPFEPFMGTVTTESLNVRTFPGDNFQIVGQLHQEDEIKIWGVPSKGGWYEITFENRSRFICSDYVERVDENI